MSLTILEPYLLLLEWMRILFFLIIFANQKEEAGAVSVVILGGNECMEQNYKSLCRDYKHDAKVMIKPSGGLKRKMGRPDMVIFFTGAMSHKMVHGALSELKGQDVIIERCPTSSVSALRKVLEKYA